ncbi:hypothetical protein GCM10023322_71490 [Rugosimonospora acidiphila]|uniref:MbtH-like domain-containing protein n=1 Tax=Rugosimonospora acidiphila TaxID=556531 RepID=A0ABP9SLX8_9ACTN
MTHDRLSRTRFGPSARSERSVDGGNHGVPPPPSKQVDDIGEEDPLTKAPDLWTLVANLQGHRSIWPADRPIPPGWHGEGFRGTPSECGARIRGMARVPAATPAGDQREPDGSTETTVRNANCDNRLDVLLSAAAREHADQTAVQCEGVNVTYRELFSRARQTADALNARGARPGEFVGVVVDRSADAVAAVVGAVLSGAPYIPLDPDAPLPRLRQIVRQASLRLVTGAVDAELAEQLGLERVPIARATEARTCPAIAPGSPSDPIYAIFTSGSTGAPKGVVVSHLAVVNSTNARFAVFPGCPMRYLMLAPLTFDAAVAGLFFTLAAGGTLILPTDADVRDPGLIGDLVTRSRATHLDAVPSQYAAILEYEAPALRDLACVVVAGEALARGLARRHLQELPHVPLFNEYGPTEGTVWSTVHRCTAEDGGPLAPIGLPIDGVEVMLWDGNLRPVGRGEVGEIVISGLQLADGYLGQPDLTATRFLPHPVKPGQRVYLTGDLGRVDETGRLVHCGRLGQMVKVRGFRVELGEVEGWLRAQPDVVDAVVVPEHFAGTTRLVAVVVPSARTTLDRPKLRRGLADHLPSYMIPSEWREIEQMPLTKNGKRDRAAAAVLADIRPAQPQQVAAA